MVETDGHRPCVSLSHLLIDSADCWLAVESPQGTTREPWNMRRWTVQFSLSILGTILTSRCLRKPYCVIKSVTLCGNKNLRLGLILVNWSTKEAESLRLKSGLVA